MRKPKRQMAFRLDAELVARLENARDLDRRGTTTAALEAAIEEYCDRVERRAKKGAA